MKTEEATVITKRGGEDAGRYFHYMAEFIGFSERDAEAVRRTKPIIERALPDIIAKFYAHLLRYPPTRMYFLKKDGSIDEEYVHVRMRHLTNFWLRTANGVFDDDYARYVDYVGRAHTSRGADPRIYIAERYVIGQVGMVSHAISEAVSRELRDGDPDLEFQAAEAWDKLMMVILEMLSRAYGNERKEMTFDPLVPVDHELIERLADHAFDMETKEDEPVPTKLVYVAESASIPDGQRQIVKVDGLEIGVFHHKGVFYALRSKCVHQGGPVCTGELQGDILTCPWHGFQYNLTDGSCLVDPSARLDVYPVELHDGKIHLHVPVVAPEAGFGVPAKSEPGLKPNEFRVDDVGEGATAKVQVSGQAVAIYNVGGVFHATQDTCTHAGGSLSDGELEGACVMCFLHGSRFDVTNGAVLDGPADEPLKVYRVTIKDGIGRVEDGA